MYRWQSVENSLWHLSEQGDQLYKKFIQAFGFTHQSWGFAIRNYKRLLWGNKGYNAGNGWFEYIPHKDHLTVFRTRGTKRIVCVFHPYLWGEQEDNDLQEWANTRDLVYVVFPPEFSFYNPGNTYMVLIMSPVTYVEYIETIPDFPKIF